MVKTGCWYWEVIESDREIVARVVTDTEPATCAQADKAAQKAELAWSGASRGSAAYVVLYQGRSWSRLPSSGQFRPAVVATIRGKTIGLSSMRLVAEDFERRGSSSKFAMRGTPFGQPSLST